MLIINTLELDKKPLTNAVGLVQSPQGIKLVGGGVTGEMITPALHPRWATGYEGFEINPIPHEAYVKVALSRKGTFYKFVDTEWRSSQEEVYYTPEELRSSIARWAGEIQFKLQINSPLACINALKIAYQVEGSSLIDYLLDFALPSLLSPSVKLIKFVRAIDSKTFPVPSTVPVKSIELCQVLPFDALPLIGTIQTQNKSSVIKITSSIADTDVRVLFKIKPKIEKIDGVMQVTEVPCVAIRSLGGDNYRKPYVEDMVTVNGGSISVRHVYQYDEAVEVMVLSPDAKDARSIANQLKSQIEQQGYLPAPPFGLEIGVQVTSGIEINANPTGQAQATDLNAAVFRLTLINVTEDAQCIQRFSNN